jgi:hypothetical protein
LRTPTSIHTILLSLLTSFPTSENERGTKRGKERERERERERNRGKYWNLGSVASPSFSSHGGGGAHNHLQKLAKQKFMMAVELTTFRMPEDPMFLVPAEGYVVSFVVIPDFYAKTEYS